MLKIIEKISVKHWAAIAFIAMLIGIIMPLTASAETGESFNPIGAAEITEAEAMTAVAKYMSMTLDAVDEAFLFIEVPEDNCVEVYSRDTSVLSEIVYINENGEYCGYASGFVLTFDNGTMTDVVGDVAAGVGGIFDMSASGFKFITDNYLCMLMVAITLGGVAFGMLAKAFKISRK